MPTKAEWLNRPRSEGHLSFEEWREGVVVGATAAAKPSTRVQHRSGDMNGLEKRYAAHLSLRVVVNEIRRYEFESMKLRLAPSTYLTPDFPVIGMDWRLEMHEVKGFWEDDARVKIKVAARLFPWIRFVGVTWDKRKNDWKFEDFPCA